ncbi:MAG: MlaD family protein, partial [Solirubrobacteraceae bacterium]|nr:MlaD family protein [Patulibacter sp.]
MTGRLHTTLRSRAARRVAGVAAICAIAAGALSGCGGSSASASNYEVRAIFTSAPFVISGLDLKVSGVKIGKVKSVDLTDDNQAAVTLTVTDPGYKDFRKDATCRVRPQALIGERYVECTLTAVRPDGATAPGPLPAIASGPYKGEHLLPVTNTSVAIDSDEVLDVNTASVREKLGIIIRELGTGIAGRGDELQTALRKGNVALENTNAVLKQLSEQQDMLKQLTSSTDQTLQSLASERASLTGAVEHGASVTGTLARREANLKASITQLNNLLTEVKPTADRANELADQLSPIADNLNDSASDLATVLNLLPTVASRGTTAVNSLGPTLSKGREVLTSDTTNALFDRVVKTSAGVKATASVLGLTLGDFKSAGGLDYIIRSIYGIAYATNGRDANGSYLRGAAYNLLNCITSSATKSNSCGTQLSAGQSVDDSTANSDENAGSASSAATTASAAKAKTSRPSSSSSKSAPKTTPRASSATTPDTTSVEAKSASLLLG